MKYFNQRHNENGNGIDLSAPPQRRYAWEWRDDDGEWNMYSVDTTTVIELAFGSGLDAVDITENGVVYGLRFDDNVQCHFATNKVRPIRRRMISSNRKSTVSAHRPYAATADNISFNVYCDRKENEKDRDLETDDIDLEFDALSNKLENGDDRGQSDLESTSLEEMEEMKESESVERQSVPTMRDSEVALDEYGNDYDEYIATFNRLRAYSNDS